MGGKVVVTDSIWGEVEVETRVLEVAGLQVVLAPNPEVLPEIAQDAVALIVQYAPITRQLLARLPQVRVISRYGVGVDNVDLEAARELGIWIANVPDYGTEEVTLHTLALILALLRRVPIQNQLARQGHWDSKAAGPIPRASHLTLGLVGLGRIGRRVAEKARNFFGKILAYDPWVSSWPEEVAHAQEVAQVFRESQVVSLHLPLTRETKGLVGRELLALMPQGSYLVNTARGGLVQVEAVRWALEEGILEGVALDVLPQEPPSSELLTLLDHPKVVLTPHMAWYSEASEKELRRLAAYNVLYWAQTGRPLYPVEVSHG